jgi:hypothetical protein
MNFDCQGWRITPIELRPPYVSANPGETKPAAIPLSQRQTLSRQSRPPLNPLERLKGEIKRRTEVVGIFPNEAAIVRLVCAILLDRNDRWMVQRSRYVSLETIATLRDNPDVSLPDMAT